MRNGKRVIDILYEYSLKMHDLVKDYMYYYMKHEKCLQTLDKETEKKLVNQIALAILMKYEEVRNFSIPIITRGTFTSEDDRQLFNDFITSNKLKIPYTKALILCQIEEEKQIDINAIINGKTTVPYGKIVHEFNWPKTDHLLIGISRWAIVYYKWRLFYLEKAIENIKETLEKN